MKCGNLNFLESSGPLQACYVTALLAVGGLSSDTRLTLKKTLKPYLHNKTKAIVECNANPLPLPCRDVLNIHSVVNVYLREQKGDG